LLELDENVKSLNYRNIKKKPKVVYTHTGKMALDLHRKNEFKKSKKSYDEIIKEIVNDDFPLNPLQLVGELSFDDPATLKETDKLPRSDVQEFYKDASIFITGGTGFMGKMLIEKLSRSCPHLKHIYLLIRNKKGKDVNERIDAIFEDRVSLFS